MPDVIELAAQFRAQLESQSGRATRRAVEAYTGLVSRLDGIIDALVLEIAEGELTRGQVMRLSRYKKLKEQLEKELTLYQGFLGVELQTVARDSISLSALHADRLIEQAAIDAGVAVALSEAADTNAIISLLGFLEPESALYKRLSVYGAVNAARIADLLLEGVGLGYGADKIAGLIRTQGLGMGLTDALRMVRTVGIYSYRESTRYNYARNGNIVTGWVWHSARIPGRTCMSCIAKHGSEHSLDETLNDHHNGLCAMLPMVRGRNPVSENGAAWFGNQSENVQRQMMRGSKFDAWKAGKFSIADMSKAIYNDVFGEMFTETPLKDLISD